MSKQPPFLTLFQLFGLVYSLGEGFVLSPEEALAASEKEIKVSLFGQPCTLKGPYPEKTLQTIDAMSPAQMISIPNEVSLVEGMTEQSVRDAVGKIKNIGEYPKELSTYQEKLEKRLHAILDFFEGLKPSGKTPRQATLLKSVEKHLLVSTVSPERKKFLELVKKLPKERGRVSANVPLAGTELNLFEQYLKLVEPEPDEAFHRAIRLMNVNYICSFEEGKGNSREDEDGSEKDRPLNSGQ